MFEGPISAVKERERIASHDLAILEDLQNGTRPVHYAWKALRQLQSDTTRYYAMKEFLEHRCKATRVYELTNSRVYFVAGGATVSLPSAEDAEEEAQVYFDGLPDPAVQLQCPTACEPDEQERFVSRYSSLLENSGSFAARARMRCPSLSERGDFLCTLFYCFVLVPHDFFTGKGKRKYWRNLQKDMSEKRLAQSSLFTAQWRQACDRVRNFYFSVYPSLERFHMPVMLGEKGKRIHMEEAISICNTERR